MTPGFGQRGEDCLPAEEALPGKVRRPLGEVFADAN